MSRIRVYKSLNDRRKARRYEYSRNMRAIRWVLTSVWRKIGQCSDTQTAFRLLAKIIYKRENVKSISKRI